MQRPTQDQQGWMEDMRKGRVGEDAREAGRVKKGASQSYGAQERKLYHGGSKK